MYRMRSTQRAEYPISLSYQDETWTKVPSSTLVRARSTVTSGVVEAQVGVRVSRTPATRLSAGLVHVTVMLIVDVTVARGDTGGRSLGAVVTDVAPFGPAANAGIEPGDVVLSVQNTDVRNAADAKRALDAIPSGRLARIVVWSQGAEVLRQVRKR